MNTSFKDIRQSLIFLSILSLATILGCQNNEQVDNNSQSSSSHSALFSKIPASQSGVQFSNKLEEKIERMFYNFNPIYDGGGVSLGDINNDGLVDIYFTGNEVSNKLYLNKGDFQFEDITETAGVAGGGGWHNGPTMVDINGDGYLDIYVCRGGWIKDENRRRNLLFINNGDNTFKEQAGKYGIAERGYSFQSCFLDYDNDGDLDLYIINHPAKSNIDTPEYEKGRKSGHKHSKDRLYRNNGNNTFSDITESAGMSGTFGFGLSVTSADLDGNGFADVYVTNDYTEPDYLFMNNGDGTFTNKIQESMAHIPLFSMGTDIADFNNDGLEDIFNTEMLPDDYKRSKTMMADMNPKRFEFLIKEGYHRQYMHNALQLNRGNGKFSEMSQMAGISKTDWSWACFLSDLDNDGLRDVFVSNGYRRDVYDKDSAKKRQAYLKANNNRIPDLEEFYKLTPVSKSINYIFKNNGDLTFSKKIKEWGINHPSFSNGAALSDLDNDGDLDIVVNNFEEPAFLYRNNADKNSSNHYLRLKLNGPKGNPHGIGTKVKLSYGDQIQFEQFKMTRGYLSSLEPIMHFGLGAVNVVDKISVEWSDGKTQILENIKANQVFEVDYNNAADTKAKKESKKFLLAERNDLISPNYKHQENEYDDYKSQILLPHRQSQNGPFTAIADVNGDGLEDFYVGGAYKQAGQLFLQNANGKFTASKVAAFEKDNSYEDMGCVFFDSNNDQHLDLYVVSGGSEFPINSAFYQDRLYLNNGKGQFTKAETNKVIPSITSSGSCVAANDYDGDGDLDLFVGGRILPNRYPFSPESFLLRNDNGNFHIASEQTAPGLKNAGMVTSAIWSDVDKDGVKDLIVAGEWMPFKIYLNRNGNLEDATEAYGLSNTVGWWNRLIEQDIDGDGDMDYIAGNLGKNYKFHASEEKPFHIYCDDFDENGSFDIVLAKYYGKTQVPVRGRQCTSEQIPEIGEKFPTFNAFADADVGKILGKEIEEALHIEARLFASAIFINEGGKFTIQQLPQMAQLSSINGIIAEDYTGDGKTDLLVAGNLYGSEAETTRADASIGLLLQGNGNGGFTPLSVLESGFNVPFDVKDLQAIKVGNKKGALVACNDDLLRLFVEN